MELLTQILGVIGLTGVAMMSLIYPMALVLPLLALTVAWLRPQDRLTPAPKAEPEKG